MNTNDYIYITTVPLLIYLLFRMNYLCYMASYFYIIIGNYNNFFIIGISTFIAAIFADPIIILLILLGLRLSYRCYGYQVNPIVVMFCFMFIHLYLQKLTVDKKTYIIDYDENDLCQIIHSYPLKYIVDKYCIIYLSPEEVHHLSMNKKVRYSLFQK